MGQAKRRGTFEQRRQQAISKRAEFMKNVEPPRQPPIAVAKRRPSSPLLAAAMLAALSGNPNQKP